MLTSRILYLHFSKGDGEFSPDGSIVFDFVSPFFLLSYYVFRYIFFNTILMLILLIPLFFFSMCESEVHGSSYLHFLQDDAEGICSGGH